MHIRRLAFVVLSSLVALAVTSCVPLPMSSPLGVGEQAAQPSVATTPSAAPTPTGPTPQEVALDAACARFDASNTALLDVIGGDVVPQATFEEYAAAMEGFAYALGDQSVQAGDTGEVPMATLLTTLAQTAAGVADEMHATGGTSAGTWLGFRTALQAVADPCGVPVTFSE